MKRVLTTALAAVFLAGPVMAQTAAPAVTEDFKPSSVNQPGQAYPQVNSQGYVRFRVTAPDAQAVKVSLGLGGRGGTSLTKGADGAWTGTTEGPMDEGFHYYHLTVDGGTFNDPGTLNFYGSTRWESGIEVPAHDADFYALKNVCAHQGARVCLGRIVGTALPSGVYEYTYGREGQILRCPWHEWEYDIATGEAVFDPSVKVVSYPVEVVGDEIVVTIGP